MVVTNNNIRICENNLGELSDSSGFTVSSEQTAYPKANAISRFRNEQYRANGNFTLNSTNTALRIRVGANSTTIALTAGNYNYETLASHISTSLNNNSTGWSATYDLSGGTYKFRITRSSSATLLLSQNTNAIWNTIGFTGTSDLTDTSFTADEQRNHTKEYVQFDLGYEANVTTFFCIGSLSEKFSISSDATILLKANNINDETQWESPPLEINLAEYRSDAGIYLFLDSLLEDTRYRFWRFHIEDKYNHQGPLECVRISNIYLGDYIYLNNRNIQNGFAKTVIDPTERSESEAGSLYWDTKTKYTIISSAGFAFIDKDDRETLERLYNRIGTSTPIYISIDPNLKITNELSDMTFFCVYNEAPTMSHVIFDKFNYLISFRELI